MAASDSSAGRACRFGSTRAGGAGSDFRTNCFCFGCDGAGRVTTTASDICEGRDWRFGMLRAIGADCGFC